MDGHRRRVEVLMLQRGQLNELGPRCAERVEKAVDGERRRRIADDHGGPLTWAKPGEAFQSIILTAEARLVRSQQGQQEHLSTYRATRGCGAPSARSGIPRALV